MPPRKKRSPSTPGGGMARCPRPAREACPALRTGACLATLIGGRRQLLLELGARSAGHGAVAAWAASRPARPGGEDVCVSFGLPSSPSRTGAPHAVHGLALLPRVSRAGAWSGCSCRAWRVLSKPTLAPFWRFGRGGSARVATVPPRAGGRLERFWARRSLRPCSWPSGTCSWP